MNRTAQFLSLAGAEHPFDCVLAVSLTPTEQLYRRSPVSATFLHCDRAVADICRAGSWLRRPGFLRFPILLEVRCRGMNVTFASLPSLEDLRRHVLQTLCSHDHLDPTQTPLHQALIKRSGRKCGLFFQVKGPRMLKTYAVWAGEENRILFYDSTGLRFAETRLSEAPDPAELAA